MNTEQLPITQVFPNIGQVKGLPKNPRFIRDEKYKKLVQSIKDDPEMLELRELIVYDTGNPDLGYVVAGGNMRYRAMKELGYKEVPCKVLHTGFPIEKLRRIVLKDNSSFGETDFELLLNEWSMDEIELAAIDLPDLGQALEDDVANGGSIGGAEGSGAEGSLVAPGVSPMEESSVTEDDDFEQNDIETDEIIKEGQMWKLGRHLLLCGDSTKQEDVQRLFPNGEQAHIWLTDPPYAVNYGFDGSMRAEKGDGLLVLNDNLSGEGFLEFLVKAFTEAKQILQPGGTYYIFHSDSNSYYFRLALMNAGDMTLRQTLIWNKNSFVMGRQDYQWKHEPCQPAGTMVQTTEGLKPIEALTNKDRVITFDTFSGQVKGYRNGGYAIETASRKYNGLMYSVTVDGKTTRATDNHEFSIRFNGKNRKRYCTYIMRRGDWWRVGHTVAYDARQFGLKSRFNQEKADEAWLLDLYDNTLDAQVGEQILAVKYGIPYTHWEVQRGLKHPDYTKIRNEEQISNIYSSLDLATMQENAHRLLHDFGRSERFPLIDRKNIHERFSTRVTAKVNACNLVPELMQIPIPTGDSVTAPNFHWKSIDAVTFEPFEGMVYSLAVEKHNHYISDGIITHNCLYGWKEGAGHNWYSDRKQSTVIDWERPTKSLDHPTKKPVGLVGYLMKNSSKKGDVVFDGFGGSGTTLIAAEQLGRTCRMIELAPHYVSVILARYIKHKHNYADVFRIEPDGSQKSIMEIYDRETLDAWAE